MNPVDTAEVTWRPSAERVARARITDFTCWLKESKGLDFAEGNAAVRAAAAGARARRPADRAHQVGHPRGLSVRHVLRDVIAVAEVPRTLTGKKLEVPVKKLLLGQPADKVAQRDAMANPDSLNWFVAPARQRGQQADHR